jgi:rubrerythrin
MSAPDTAGATAVRSGRKITEPHAGATRLGPALRCAVCGYAIGSYRSVPDCPMCHTRTWITDRHASSAPSRGLT